MSYYGKCNFILNQTLKANKMAFQRTVDVLTFEVYNATILLVYINQNWKRELSSYSVTKHFGNKVKFTSPRTQSRDVKLSSKDNTGM